MIDRYLALTLAGLLMASTSAIAGCSIGGEGDINPIEEGRVSLSVVYDNYQVKPELTTNWGFGCVVTTPYTTLLFDTGGRSSVLLSNMEKMGIDPKDIDIVVISHIHGDHLGGLEGFLEENREVSVYIPSCFPDSIRRMINRSGATFQNVAESTRIADGIYTTGELGTGIKEQSLVLNTRKGLVVVTGCAHPGVVEIAKRAKNLLEEEIYLIMGGFHLSGASEGRLQSIFKSFKELGVQKVAPSHCSGDQCRKLFAQEYGDGYIESGVGKVIVIQQ